MKDKERESEANKEVTNRVVHSMNNDECKEEMTLEALRLRMQKHAEDMHNLTEEVIPNAHRAANVLQRSASHFASGIYNLGRLQKDFKDATQ